MIMEFLGCDICLFKVFFSWEFIMGSMIDLDRVWWEKKFFFYCRIVVNYFIKCFGKLCCF